MDLLLARYASADIVLQMDVDAGLRMIGKAIEKEREKRHWDQWIANLPHMTRKTFVPFNRFYRPQRPGDREVASKSATEILADVDSLLDSMRKGVQ